MARMLSLKTCLFSLMALVLTITLFLISKFQAHGHGHGSSSLAGEVLSDRNRQYLLAPNKDEDISAFYRRSATGSGLSSKLNSQNRNNVIIKSNIDYPFDEDVIHNNNINNNNNLNQNQNQRNIVYSQQNQNPNNQANSKNNKVIKSNSKAQKFKQLGISGHLKGKERTIAIKGGSTKTDENNVVEGAGGEDLGELEDSNNNNIGDNLVVNPSASGRGRGHWKALDKADLGVEGDVNNNKNEYEATSLVDITCDVNNGKFILECKKDENEVYVPFSFLHKYFEVFGKMSEKDESKFIWLHSQVKIFKPKTPYNPQGVFTYFENYNVEVRDRVKCVSGSAGVPVSTQWDRNGYFYPIQIAQFGLAHYSKYIVEGEPERVILEDGDGIQRKWSFHSNSDLSILSEPLHTFNHILQIQHTSVNQPVTLQVSGLKIKTKSSLLVLSWDMKTEVSNFLENGQNVNDLKYNASVTVTMRYEGQLYYLHYVTADFLISVRENHIYHGLGQQSFTKWQHIIRDLGVDVQKGVSFAFSNNGNSHRKSHNGNKSAKKIIRSKLSIDSIALASPGPSGTGAGSVPTNIRLYLDNLTLSSHEHLAQFYQSADWFVSTQDAQGGWPIPVRRKFSSDFYPVLEPGWYSAMGQGHALSLLSRAYALTKKKEYAQACYKAVEKIFDLPGREHGVQAIFMNKYVWYEEYPTTPSTFVLNGFMYALLGLYDVKMLLPQQTNLDLDFSVISKASKKATDLYDKGLISLKTMLPLYDTGSGTMYDLKHFTVPGISPNPARLDYHVTHINQLLVFATIDQDPIFESTADRWIAYTEGDRAPHN